MRAASLKILLFLSPFVLFGLWWWLSEQSFVYFTSKYYNSSFVRFLWYAALLLLVTLLSRSRNTRGNRSLHFLELVAALVLLALSISALWRSYRDMVLTLPTRDMGQITQQAAVTFFLNKENPYANKEIAKIKIKNGESYAGFKYGPVMFFGFGVSAFQRYGIKVTNIALLVITAFLVTLLSVSGKFSLIQNLASAVFVVTAAIIPEKIWYELFVSGAPDLLPCLLVLASLAALKYKKLFLAGLFVGLSVSTKVAPAIFLIIVYLRPPFDKKLWIGTIIGLCPTVIFFLWAPWDFLNNVLLFHVVKGASASSVISITPVELHWLFPLIQCIAIILTLSRNWNRSLTVFNAAFSYLSLLIIIEMTYGEVHGNHLLWFLPLVAVVLCWKRLALPNIFCKLLPGVKS